MNVIKIFGEITEYTFRDVLNSILDILKNENTDKIIVLINSQGGRTDETNSIIDLFETIPNDIITVNLGKAESAAGIIFIHGKERYIAKHAKFMMHCASTIFEKQTFSADGLAREQRNLQKVNKQLEEYLSTKTKLPKEMIREALSSNVGLTFDADECIKYGIATRTIENLDSILSNS
ncbi:MAG: ATP-dependent Clp protease proteolytic subunit [Clostridia bacterium]|nr:ATP-dependent Clp protease proteolytic subunit [Clostridia bacterium]